MYQIDTIGMEFETTSRFPDEFYRDDIFHTYFRSTHDASIESPISLLRRGIYIINDGKIPSILNNLERATAGIELVSIPLTFNEMEKAVTLLTKRLFKYGARDAEERSAIHIHCAYPISHKILINTVKLGLSFESLIFHLGGMGYSFRGETNNSIFCRPLTMFGPPIVKNRNEKSIQLLNIEEVLKSENMDLFWKNFGGIDMNNPPSRYHPVRYFFLNIFSAILHSTLEFRIFNTTLNIDYILACMRFCQEFTKLCLQSKNSFDFISSVYDPIMSSQELLDKFLYYTDMEPEYKKTLFAILNKTPYPKIEPKYIETHLREYQFIDSIWKNPRVFSRNEFEQSGFIDIHNFPTNIPSDISPRLSLRLSTESISDVFNNFSVMSPTFSSSSTNVNESLIIVANPHEPEDHPF